MTNETTGAQAPTPGPLTSESVKLLVKGDLLLGTTHGFNRGEVRVFEGAVIDPREAGAIHYSAPIGGGTAHVSHFAFIGRPIDADGWIEHDGSDRNPLPGATVDARGSKFVLEPTARPSEEIKWDRVRMWRLSASRLAPTAPVEASDQDDDLKLIIAHTIIEDLRAQHPGIKQIDNERGDIWLPGGSTPQSSGCIVDIHSVAQSVEQQVLAALRPGHTDLMVSPESIDAFLEANPPPVEASGSEREDAAFAAKYPLHAEVKARSAERQAIANFLDWLEEQGSTICQDAAASPRNYDEYVPDFITKANRIAAYMGIDPSAFDDEKRAMLAEIQEGAAK